ncbi:MAG: NTP transferase domain-containing protein [Candidatus Aminicenantes bacterium]|nr:MAG: NTP transferase domain-containing protein [Candidatus Aminicenantes bacterium]
MTIDITKYLNNSWTHQKGVNGKIKITVLAAGLGKRMEPLTIHHLPKPMFPIGGVPMIEMWVKKAVKSGITDISMNIHVLGKTIEDYFGNGARFGANINYVKEDKPSGTLGGVCKQALGNKAKKVDTDKTMPVFGEFKGTTIIAPSGDIVTDFDAEMLEQMYDIHKKKRSCLYHGFKPYSLGKKGRIWYG